MSDADLMKVRSNFGPGCQSVYTNPKEMVQFEIKVKMYFKNTNSFPKKFPIPLGLPFFGF